MKQHGPILKLNNGVQMPAVGLGVYQSKPEDTVTAVKSALNTGYRLIDTAAAYGNEREVGEGIRQSGIPRSEIFVESKLWISDYGYDEAMRGFDGSLKRLGLDYVDLYLLHQPVPKVFESTKGAYKALEQLLRERRVRAIGVSNFSPTHLTDLMKDAQVVPAVNQVEVSPFFVQKELREVHQRWGIVTQSWSPIGGVNRYFPGASGVDVLQSAVVVEIAKRHEKTPAQVILRWHIQHGLAPIPKSITPKRIAENFNIFDFNLTDDEMSSIDKLDTGVRGGPDPEIIEPKVFSFKVEN